MKDWTTLDGFFETNNQKEYSRLVSLIPDGSLMVEVGSFRGKSLCSIAPLILQKKLSVISVDIFGSVFYFEPGVNNKEAGMLKDFVTNVHDAGLDPLVICGKSKNAAEFCKMGNLHPALVFIDAEHTYEAVKSDIETWWPLLLPGGIISGHDYSLGGVYWPGVFKAVNEIFPNKHHADLYIWSAVKE